MIPKILSPLFIAVATLICSTAIAQTTVIRGEEASKINASLREVVLDNDSAFSLIKFSKGVGLIKSVDLDEILIEESSAKFISKKTKDLSKGLRVDRFRQAYKGIEVLGTEYIVRSKNGQSLSGNGKYYQSFDNDISVIPQLSETAALQIALKDIDANSYMWESDEESSKHQNNNNYYPKGDLYISSYEYKKENPLKLVYQFEIYSKEPIARYIIEIDANSGAIVNKYNKLHTEFIASTGESMYDGEVEIESTAYGDEYHLEDQTRGNGIFTFDMLNAEDFNSAVPVAENDNHFDEDRSMAGVSAHYGAAKSYDYYFSNFGLDSYDGNGAIVYSYVHFSHGFFNAFWDGFHLAYGDGDLTNSTALVSLDIVGHEFTHAVTEYSADLIYMNESGALNESFSDIFGQAIEFEYMPETASWNLGDQIYLNGTDMVRSMSNPNSQGQPDTYFGDLWYEGSGDAGGVHINSGVQNYWFYLLVEGGSGTNELGTTYNVTGIGLDKAQEIAFLNLQAYLTENSTYVDARAGAELAAIELFGEGSVELESVQEAWEATGVPSLDPNLSLPAIIDVGPIIVDSERTFNITIDNTGLGTLSIDTIYSTLEELALEQTSLILNSESSYHLEISLQMGSIGEFSEELIFETNAGDYSVALTGQVVDQPNFTVSPLNISEELLKGDTAQHRISITNSNSYDLEFDILTEEVLSEPNVYSASEEMVQVGKEVLPLYKLINTQQVSFANEEDITGGYGWRDTNQGMKFNWYDIQNIGASVSLGDDGSTGLLDIGFSFPFFEERFDQLSISSNGWLSFTNSSSTIFNNPLPNSNVPENVIAIMATDLHPRGNGVCHYLYDESNSRFIIQYTNWSLYCCSNGNFTMQIQLYKNGTIQLLYKEIINPRTASVGIQNSTKDKGLTISYNDTQFFKNEYGVEIFNNTSWLKTSVQTQLVEANTTRGFNAIIESKYLTPGAYSANASVQLKTFDWEEDTIDFELTVLDGANLVSEEEVNFDVVFPEDTTYSTFYIKNYGSDSLSVSSISKMNNLENFLLDVSNDQIVSPLDSLSVTIGFTAASAGIYQDTLALTSNDAEVEEFMIALNGEVVDPPVMQVNPESFGEALLTNESSSQTLRVSNQTGSSSLYYNLSAANFSYNPPQTGNSALGVTTNKRPYGGNGRLFIIGYNQNSIKELDPVSGEALNEIPLEGIHESPEGLTFNGTNLYYFDSFGETIFKISPETGYRIDSMDVSSESFFGLADAGEYLYATDPYNQSIHKIDFENKEIVDERPSPVNAYNLCYASDRGTFFSFLNNQVVEFDVESGDVISASTFYRDNFYSISYSQSQSALMFSEDDSSFITVVDPDSWEILYTIEDLDYTRYAIAADEVLLNSGWLNLSLIQDTVQAGESNTVDIHFDATDLFGGTYTADLMVNSNDPDSRVLVIPIILEVTGVPLISLDVDQNQFNDLLVGQSDTLVFRILNTGTSVLEGSVTLDNSNFESSSDYFSIPPKATEEFGIYFLPSQSGTFEGEVALTSNDQANGTMEFTVAGKAFDYPSVSFDPENVAIEAFAGDRVEIPLNITSRNEYDLLLDVEVYEEGQGFTSSSINYQKTNNHAQTGKKEMPFYKLKRNESRNSAAQDDITGGYSWADNVSGNADFNWYDISTIGTNVNLSDDDNSSFIDIGFSFPFFDQAYSQVSVGSNGWISFTNNSGNIWSSPLPSGSAPENVIAILANDLYPGNGSCDYYYDEGNNRFIIQYTEWTYCCNSNNNFTMQIQLYRNGRIKLLYMDVRTTAYGTIGIQNLSKDKGLTVSAQNSDLIQNGYAVEIQKMPNWLTTEVQGISIDSLSSATFNVIISTEGLLAGNYEGALYFSNEKYGIELDTIPITLTLEGASNINIATSEIDFGQVIVNEPYAIELNVSNSGTDELQTILEVSGDGYAINKTEQEIPAGSSETLQVEFESTSVGTYDGVLTIETNDPNNSNIELALKAIARNQPTLGLSETQVVQELSTNETATRNLTISNASNSADLTYTIRASVTSGNSFQSNTSTERNIGFYSKRESKEYRLNLDELPEDFGLSSLSDASGVIIDTLENLPDLTTGAVFAEGNFYLVDYSNARLVQYDIQSQQVVNSFSIHNNPFSVFYDGEYFWIGDADGVVRGYDINGQLIGDFDINPNTYSAFTSLDYDGSLILGTPAFLPGNVEITKYDFAGVIHGNYISQNPVEVLQTEIHNGNICFLNKVNNNINIIRGELEGENVVLVDTITFEYNNPMYGIAHTGSSFIVTGSEKAFVVNDNGTGWFTVNKHSGSLTSGVSEDLQISFDANGITNGVYTGELIFYTNDPENHEATVQVAMSIGNSSPKIAQDFENVRLSIEENSIKEFDLSDHFSDSDGDPLLYEINYEGSAITIERNGNRVFLIPEEPGRDTVYVSASDGASLAEGKIFVEVVRGPLSNEEFKNEIELYPNPTTNGQVHVLSSEKFDFDIVNSKGQSIDFTATRSPIGFKIMLNSAEQGLYFIRFYKHNRLEFTRSIMIR